MRTRLIMRSSRCLKLLHRNKTKRVKNPNIVKQRDSSEVWEWEAKMLRLKRLSSATTAVLNSKYFLKPEFQPCSIIPSKSPSQWTSNRFLDFYQVCLISFCLIARQCLIFGRKEGFESKFDQLLDNLWMLSYANVGNFSLLKRERKEIYLVEQFCIMLALSFVYRVRFIWFNLWIVSD